VPIISSIPIHMVNKGKYVPILSSIPIHMVNIGKYVPILSNLPIFFNHSAYCQQIKGFQTMIKFN
jgi:hypothetical protein